MKTSNQGNKYAKFLHLRLNSGLNKPEESQVFNQEINEERIISEYRPKDRVYYYDNSSISMSYGQYNVEKCLVVLFILIVYSSLLLYSYYISLDNMSFILLISGAVFDVIISFMYLYILVKLKSDEIFNKIPLKVINSTDILIMINFFLKIVTIILIFVNYYNIGLSAILLFSTKFLFEFYFAVISIKLLIFCPCTVYIQEHSEKLWNWAKYYIFCCEVEETENPDYTKLEDLESFY
jgi:hypothetical protein